VTLDDFEEYFDDTIMRRARDYYKSGAVLSLEEDVSGEWVAEVEETENYMVSVFLKDGQIIDSVCDCPYDSNAHCKHQGAVLYVLRDKFKNRKPSSGKEKSESLEEILTKLTKEELTVLLTDFAKKDKHIKNEIQLRYSDKSDVLHYARKVIKTAINAVKHSGFVEYRDTHKAIQGMESVLDMIDGHIKGGGILTAVSLCTVVLEEALNLTQYCDDSNGE
jgi:uncharacterized Zn finger protein